VAPIAALVAALALVGAVACGTPAPVATPAPTSSMPSASTSTSTTIAFAGRGFSDADNGRTAEVAVGQVVTVILHSSDYVFAPPSDLSVLRDDGPPTVTPGGPACVEVGGCGTVVASFVALAPGEAALSADRPGCVEPECPPGTAHWEIAFQVVGENPPVPPSTVAEPTTTVATDPLLESEVRGTVLFSPVCPVESIPPDPACAPRPGPADIELVRPDGSVAAAAGAGDDGSFAIAVAPGRYAVGATVRGPGIGGGCQADPPEVTVDPGAPATVTISCDTGIR